MLEVFGYKIIKRKHIDTRFFNKFAALSFLFSREEALTIFDVGANVGQSVMEYRKHFPKSVIHSFEPVPEAFAQLLKTVGHWRGLYVNQVALGSKAGEIRMHMNLARTQNSSVLPVNYASLAVTHNLHPKAELSPENYSEAIVEMTTIDTYCSQRNVAKINLLKIDVQGYEVEVLRGATSILPTTDCILVEITLDDVYTRPASFFDVEEILRPFGFRLYDISHIYKDLERGRTLWVDAIYTKQQGVT